jgi:alpha-glucoside transport system permease protein
MAAGSSMVLASTLTDSASKLWGVVEVVVGFVAIMLIIFLVAGRATGRLQKPLALIVCLVPAVVLALVGLIIPAFITFYTSMHNTQLIGTKGKYIGFKNYTHAFTDPTTQAILVRTLEWLIIVPAASTAVGLLVAILVDRIRLQSLAKSLIFMPTAISFVGASVIWQYVYNYVDPSEPQTGLLSEIAIKLGWSHPPNWLLDPPLNTFLLMVIMIWIQTGFAMVVLGAALKAIPDEIVEAARMDGATGVKLFRTVQIPMIRNTLIVVITTIMIATLKVFDIVYTITDGNYNTDVLSSRMYSDIFVESQAGRGSALAVILFVVVLPLVVYNIMQMRKDRAGR